MIRLAPLLLLPSVAWASPYLRTWHTPVPGEPLVLRVSGLTPGERAVVVGGPAAGSTCPPGLAICLGVANARVLASDVAAANGSVELTVVLPASMAVGSSFALQAVEPSTGQVSMVVTRTVSAPIAIFGVWDGAVPVEIDDQTSRDANEQTELADFDNAQRAAFSAWTRPNGWQYWERIDWIDYAGSMWMCRSLPNPSERTVRLQAPADPTAPDVGGCHGGPWVELLPAEPDLAGAWRDPAGRPVVIDASGWSWGPSRVTASRFSNIDGVMIGRNDAGTPHAGRWSRLDLAWVGGQPAACLTRSDAPTEWAARSAPAADPADPARGCAGGAWSALRP